MHDSTVTSSKTCALLPDVTGQLWYPQGTGVVVEGVAAG